MQIVGFIIYISRTVARHRNEKNKGRFMMSRNCVCVRVLRFHTVSLLFTNFAMNVTSLEGTPTLQLLFNCSHLLIHHHHYHVPEGLGVFPVP